MINLTGTTIEHYQILVKIRETPTRVLYKVFNTKSQTFVALEVVKISWLKPDDLLDLINKQVRRNAELAHPNIARIVDTGLYNGLIYLVYGFSPALPMRRFFNRSYPWKEMAREFVSITHAIAYAHENDVIHGALHPASIVLDTKRNPILFDFGIERLISDYILAHAPGAWINRWGLEYRAPEQLSGAAPDPQGDIYALGIMLAEWLIGKSPQPDTTIIDGLQKSRSARMPPAENKSVPPVVKNLVRKCAALDPKERYQSMQEVYIILARGALDMSITRRMVRKPLAIPVTRIKLNRTLVWRLSLGAILAAIALMAFLGRSTISAALLPPTLTPTRTQLPPTASPTPVPTSTPPPPPTAIPPTATPLIFPVFQDVSLSSAVNQPLSPNNVDQMIMLSVRGLGNVNRLASAPDGSHVAAASSIGIFIFNAESLELEKYIDTRSSITALEFSRSNHMMATGDSDGLVQIWNTQTWEEFETPYSGHLHTIIDLAFSPDGTRLASVDSDSNLIQWQVNSAEGPQPQRITVIGGALSIAYSDDGAHILTGNNDLLMSVWDAKTLTLEQKKAFSGKVVDIATVQGSDNLFVIGGNDQRVALLDLNSGTDPKTVGYLRYPLTGVAVSDDGRLIAAGDLNGGIAVWEADGDEFNQVLKPENFVLGNSADLEAPGNLHSLSFGPNGDLLFSGLHDGVLRSINTSTGEEAQRNQLLNAHVIKAAVSHSGQYLITQQDGDTVTMWDLWSGTARYQLQGEIASGDPFSQNDRRFTIVSAGPGPKTADVYNAVNGDEIYHLKSQPQLRTIRYINDDTQLISVYDKFIELWSMSSGQKLETNPAYDGSGCQTIKDIDNQNVVSITNYQYVVTNNSNKPGLCQFSPLDWKFAVDEERGMIVYGGESVLAIADARSSDSPVQNLRGVNRKNIVSVAISSSGELVAAAYDDHSIHIWDTTTRDELTRAQDGLYGHTDTITDLRFTPDGKLLISVSLDGTIRLWGVPQ